jgi:GDP-L-fucose synthase
MTEPRYDLAGKRVFVAGHRGMVGSAVVRRLASEDCEIVTARRAEVDLTRQAEVEAWMERTRPHAVVLAAAKVGGILANDREPAPFLYENLMIEANVIHAAHLAGVEKLLFLGSSCIYPKMAPQPITEDALLTGPLEPTNQWYSIAKIAGLKMCQAYRRQYGADFISAMPTNLYGPGDNFHPTGSHVAAALLAKTHAARMRGAESLELWGTGTPLREFMHVDDLADALVFLLRHYSAEEHVNVGSGQEISIRGLADLIGRVVGWHGAYEFDAGKPDGTPRKLMDGSRLFAMGWRPSLSLEEGFARTYAWYVTEGPGRP